MCLLMEKEAAQAACRTTLRTSVSNKPMTTNRPTSDTWKRAVTRRFASMTWCHAGCILALMCERSPINTSGRGRKSRRRQRVTQPQ
jgi:hypothetical protein